MKSLFEGGTDHTALQRLRRSVVVHHATWSFSLSCEQETAKHGHLMGKVSESKKERKKERKEMRSAMKSAISGMFKKMCLYELKNMCHVPILQ